MANYYEILKVSPNATRPEIKSAYRRLARKLHPDKNHGSEETARAFAQIAEAWEILGDAQSRSIYDKRLLHVQMHHSGETGDSLFVSSNTHARRWRQMVYEHRYNEIIDRMMAEERSESMALQKVIFPLVALFVSCLVVAMFKPQIFEISPIIGKIILVSLFIAGVIHMWGRIKDGLERFTYGDTDVHESILDDNDRQVKPFSRVFAAGFLILGVGLSLGIGLMIGNIFQIFPTSVPAMFSTSLKPEFVFYPPIFVYLVDVMHGFASRVDI
jgi:hypothetical protein